MIIFTDGSALRPDGPGGISVLIQVDGDEWMAYAARLENTTSPKAELLAVLIAVVMAPRYTATTVYTDCYYVSEGAQSWLSGWKRRGFRNSRGKRIAHRHLWERLDALLELKKVKIHRVRGHQGNPANEAADLFAKQAAHRATESKEVDHEH